MLPARFDYETASTVEEAIDAKVQGGDETRFLAGGQSLLPMMKLRFASPAKLIDINRINGLDKIERRDGTLHIGALARHADVVASSETFGAIASAAPWIADPLVRNLGTMCGSVAHCDPEGDWNSVLLATGADVVARGSHGERTIAIGDFIRDFFENALADDEMVTGLRIAVPSARSGGDYQKLERKIGDYATVGVAAQIELSATGAISKAGLALTAVAPINTKVADAETVLIGNQPSEGLFAEAAEIAAAACSPRDDVRGSARWKRRVVAAFTRRALAASTQQAQAQG